MNWKKWFKAAGIRAIRTFAEAALAYIGTGAIVLGDVNWLAVLSAGGFGFVFRESHTCRGVLTLGFDDIVREVEGAVLFTEEQAERIIDFIEAHVGVETLLVHCYGGQSRSRAVGAFAVKMLGGNNARYFETGRPNEHVYETLERVWQRRRSAG